MVNRKVIVWLIAAIWAAIALILWLSVLGPSSLPVIIAEPLKAEPEPNTWASRTQQPARLSVHNATTEDFGRLSEAVMAFATADLELPTLEIWFHADRGPCGEHHGLFRATSESWQIRICSSEIKIVYEHELAHAWVAANVGERQRSVFMKLRGLEHWADRDVPWNERGTEWAAVVIQQGLSGLPLPPALSNEARSRLESYELLTGKIAPSLVDWIREREVTCSDRPTGLSRPIADRSGRTCGSFSSLTEHEMTFPTTSLVMHSSETLQTFVSSVPTVTHYVSGIPDDAEEQVSTDQSLPLMRLLDQLGPNPVFDLALIKGFPCEPEAFSAPIIDPGVSTNVSLWRSRGLRVSCT